MKKLLKAQQGKAVKKKPVSPVSTYKGLKDAWGKPVGGEGNVPPFSTKKTKAIKKAKSGTSVKKCKYGCK